jgi:hypothetical protein
MAEPPKKRLKPDVNYSTPSYSQRRSTEMDMFSPNGGFGPVGFRTPFSIPNTPISIAGDTPTLGNLPIRDPVAPLRGFFEIVEKADRKICNGTTISKCRSGTIAATSDDCGTCRMDIKDLKKTICKNWNDFKSDPLKQRSNRVKLMTRHNHLLEKFDGYWRVDILEAIGRVSIWKPKVDKMKALWFKDAVMEEIILEIPEGEVQLASHSLIHQLYFIDKNNAYATFIICR